jgi:hypothetical protein
VKTDETSEEAAEKPVETSAEAETAE